MPSSTQGSAGTPEARRPRGPRGFVRVTMVAAWAVFWFSTAIFPCCESIAAVLGGEHHIAVAESDPVAPQAHHSGDVNSEGQDHGPHSPCESALGAVPTLVGEQEVLASEHFSMHWIAIEQHSAFDLKAVAHRPSLALPHGAPPPLGFYQRSQRLLI